MPLPAILWGILELVAAAITLYEMGELAKDLYEGYEKYGKDIDKAKEEVRKIIESIKKEIGQKIEQKEEIAILLALTAADPQGQQTRKAAGRGAGENVINAAIEQRIPFRDAISKVCDAANRMPILSLRRKKGVSVKDLPRAKRKVLEELLGKALEEIADVDLDEFIVIRLRQLAVNLLFEFIDECLDWSSPLKAEVSFGPRPAYDDHPVDGTTRLKRLGKVNPFYPGPYQYRKGSLSADLMISEYRHERPDKGNIFAIVEIKFENDRIEAAQFDAYNEMLRRAAVVKTGRAPTTYKGQVVNSGGRLSLFRFPEDVADHSNKDRPQEEQSPARKKAPKGGKGHKGH
ncbi:MAG: hypothetical protein JSR41_07080 [Proteobacteria bacterium]|nr:hypothetical protein [Pseudomonadota bacterium]